MPSRFLQLFKRGRYVSLRALAGAETDAATRQNKHEERERFSVAAIAFSLEHDQIFKSHFLNVVACLTVEDIHSITVEPERWGDLVLEGAEHVLVLEFKLAAMLQEHQSPDARIFSANGYGASILRRFNKLGKKLRYIVVGKDFRPCKPGRLQCSAVPWFFFLVADHREESEIETDLYDCLGYLGAPVFLNRYMKNPKLTL